jgi:3',5'-cyclic AMP phosphodiesterase CpdA
MGQPLFSFAVIADTHTRPEGGDESSPWAVNRLANGRARYVVERVRQMRPAFAIHLGDVVHPVPALPTYEAAAEAALSIMGRLECPVSYLPGNHDVGDKPFPAMPAARVSDPWVARYRALFGAPFSSFDHGGCHFVLINSPVLNSGLEAEAEQRPWLEADLEASAGKRIFLFTHYPPYVTDAGEPSNYDNLDEPGRSWLLELLERHRVEALFAGHVHNFFYHRHGGCDCYLLPATSFFRQDYAELFRVEAAPEHGRNDADKLGFFTVDVLAEGHVARCWRTAGRVLDPGATLEPGPAGVTPLHPRERARAPLGVHLRHPWAEVTELPYNGPMDEFHRKRARNDHTLLTLWELGVRHLRVPAADLLEARTRERMRALVAMGHRFTVFGFGAPAPALCEGLAAHRELVHAFETVAPWGDAASLIGPLAALRGRTGVPVQLAKMETSAEKKTHGSRFAHFVSYGFRRDELALVDAFLERPGARDAVDAFVFRAGPEDRPWDEVSALHAAATARGVGAVVNVRLADDNPAVYAADDDAVARRVAEALAAAHAHEPVEVFLDTYVDLDRGYFPRHGLFDRRYNPRPASFVYRHLQGLLGRMEGPLAPGAPVQLVGGTLFPLRGARATVGVVVPREGAVAPGAVAAAMAGAEPGCLVDLATGHEAPLARAEAIASPALLR